MRSDVLQPRDGDQPTNLPTPLTSFIGWQRELAEVGHLLTTSRLVTLTGVGGCGKTRLAVEVARGARAEYSDGVWVVELAALADPERVPLAVAAVLGVTAPPGQSVTQALARHLQPRQLLLLLDNCEHLVSACTRMVVSLLVVCPGLRVLVTSREVLGITGEVVWRVPSLSLPPAQPPPAVEHLSAYAAVQLFLDRARAVRPSLTLTARNAPAVVTVCTRLDGIPLAIELAAARVNVLAIEEVAARLDDRFRLLTGGSRAALARQQTLRATVEWSLDLLSPFERGLFERLAVFANGWTLAAAEAVSGDQGAAAMMVVPPTFPPPVPSAQPPEVLDLLARLVDKSLVIADLAQDGTIRYRLLETLRQYAWDRLVEQDAAATARDRHAAYFLALAEATEPKLIGPAYGVWLGRLEAERDNLHASLLWVEQQGHQDLGLRLCGALAPLWLLRGSIDEGWGWLTRLLRPREGQALERAADDQPGSRAARAKALLGAGALARRRGDYAMSRALLGESLALYEALGDASGRAPALLQLGITVNGQGDTAAALPLLEESLAVHRGLGNTYGVTLALLQLALLAFWNGDDATAQQRLAENEAAYRDRTDRNRESTLWLAGLLAIGRGDLSTAQARLEESLALLLNAGDVGILPLVIDGFAILAATRRQPARALRLAGAAATLRERGGLQVPPAWQARSAPVWAWAHQALGAAAAASAAASGAALSLEQVLATELVADEVAQPAAQPAAHPLGRDPLAELTRRELEVLHLVARGLTNRQVAATLAIGVRTVDTHVTNLLSKLGLASRVHLAAWAGEQGLIGGGPD